MRQEEDPAMAEGVKEVARKEEEANNGQGVPHLVRRGGERDPRGDEASSERRQERVINCGGRSQLMVQLTSG